MSNIVDLKQITKLNAINKHTYTAPLALFLDQKNQKKRRKKMVFTNTTKFIYEKEK